MDTAFALMLRRILLVNGLDLKRGDYELVAAGAGLQRVDSMKRGETFAAIINAPFDTQAQSAGTPLPLQFFIYHRIAARRQAVQTSRPA